MKEKIESGIGKRLARAFFGKETCVRFEHNGQGSWMMVGRKNDTGWDWSKAKMNAGEFGSILCVLSGKSEKAEFFHTFQKDGAKSETRITVNKAPDGPNVFFRVGEHAKPLNPGEQEVLRVFLERALNEDSEDDWQPQGGDAL